MWNTKKNIIQKCTCQPGMHSLGSKKQDILIKTLGLLKGFFNEENWNPTLIQRKGWIFMKPCYEYFLMWAKFTSNEILWNTKENLIQMFACPPGIQIFGAKKRGTFIKTSKGGKIFLFVRGGLNYNTESKKQGCFYERPSKISFNEG